ncbi:protein of unknown function [Georgfuchsia toluolica]|uniref:Uncharacterized protein n=2 Tax=Georgfuchsia toluolica TaxID=424218 RepID=A0A916J7F6_9PROT|nr:protein of unknown function [Georgfuchsia toluolica]
MNVAEIAPQTLPVSTAILSSSSGTQVQVAHAVATPQQLLAADIIDRWKTDPAIRAEFGTVTYYAAYRRAIEAGNVRMLPKAPGLIRGAA